MVECARGYNSMSLVRIAVFALLFSTGFVRYKTLPVDICISGCAEGKGKGMGGRSGYDVR